MLPILIHHHHHIEVVEKEVTRDLHHQPTIHNTDKGLILFTYLLLAHNTIKVRITHQCPKDHQVHTFLDQECLVNHQTVQSIKEVEVNISNSRVPIHLVLPTRGVQEEKINSRSMKKKSNDLYYIYKNLKQTYIKLTFNKYFLIITLFENYNLQQII
jgi:hypothetical protein